MGNLEMVHSGMKSLGSWLGRGCLVFKRRQHRPTMHISLRPRILIHVRKFNDPAFGIDVQNRKGHLTLCYRYLQISSWEVCPSVTMFRHHFLSLMVETEELSTCILSSTCRLLYRSNEQSDFSLSLAKYFITI